MVTAFFVVLQVRSDLLGFLFPTAVNFSVLSLMRKKPLHQAASVMWCLRINNIEVFCIKGRLQLLEKENRLLK